MSPSASPHPVEKKRNRLLAPLLGLLAGVILLTAAGVLYVYAQVAGPGPRASQVAGTEVTIGRGMSIAVMARTLERQHVIRSGLLFRLTARLRGHHNIQAGTYLFPSQAPMLAVLEQMEQGKVEQTYVTIPEGKTSAQVVRILMAVPGLTGDVDVPPEGAILPETYLYQRGETREAVLERMLVAGRKTLDELWAKRAPGLPYASKEDALIMASVVEKETGKPDERPRVAAVFINRLRSGMRLESDPTVIYGVSHGEPLGRGLLKSELETPSPWNTYLIAKLPVTPIANPGKASLEAVLNPAPTKDLYFVADGTGGHVFAATYEEHLVNVARWRQIEAQAQDQMRGQTPDQGQTQAQTTPPTSAAPSAAKHAPSKSAQASTRIVARDVARRLRGKTT